MTDYVIVGAGSAGCVVANRLSADPSVRVTLLEAGGRDKKMEIRIPAAFGKLFTTDYDWNYRTAPQPQVDDRALYWPRGRTLGGSSSMNAQMWVRGHRADYDAWAEAGCDGWSYDDVLPYFRRAERCTGAGADGSHGTGGPLFVQDLRDPNPTTTAFLAACTEVGIRRLPHHNVGDNEGVAQTIVTQRRGRRWSTADAYLRPAAKRDNLQVATGAHATRIVIDSGRAVGVEYRDRNGRTHIFGADREVILCGGAVNSPQLLMLSGIGHPDELAEHGIDMVTAAPGVGANLQDHLMVALVMSCPEPVTLADAEKPLELLKYLALRRGLLTSNVGEAAAFIRTRPDLTAPDIEIIFGAAPYIDHGMVEEPPGHGIAVGPILLQPASRGRIGLASADPTTPPRIDPGYLADPADLSTLVAGVRTARRITETRALARYVGPPLEAPDGDDDESITVFIRAQAETLYHPVGTCRMGADDASVVDPELRVRGVEGLRVIDASVMPTLNRGHTHAPAVMIGERGAELVQRARSS